MYASAVRHLLSPAQCDFLCAVSSVRHVRYLCTLRHFHYGSTVGHMLSPVQYDMFCLQPNATPPLCQHSTTCVVLQPMATFCVPSPCDVV
eukprot:6227431-Pyramimonas_sp.AAC.2